jgi:hypothetical protein
VRALAFKWQRIMWRCWQDHTPDDEAKYVKALKRSDSALAENLPAIQRQLLRDWRIRFRVVGVGVAIAGTRDENLIPVLHRLAAPTFVTLDRDFFRPPWTHRS